MVTCIFFYVSMSDSLSNIGELLQAFQTLDIDVATNIEDIMSNARNVLEAIQTDLLSLEQCREELNDTKQKLLAQQGGPQVNNDLEEANRQLNNLFTLNQTLHGHVIERDEQHRRDTAKIEEFIELLYICDDQTTELEDCYEDREQTTNKLIVKTKKLLESIKKPADSEIDLVELKKRYDNLKELHEGMNTSHMTLIDRLTKTLSNVLERVKDIKSHGKISGLDELIEIIEDMGSIEFDPLKDKVTNQNLSSYLTNRVTILELLSELLGARLINDLAVDPKADLLNNFKTTPLHFPHNLIRSACELKTPIPYIDKNIMNFDIRDSFLTKSPSYTRMITTGTWPTQTKFGKTEMLTAEMRKLLSDLHNTIDRMQQGDKISRETQRQFNSPNKQMS